MREIKFRGYNAKNKEWLYGCYLINRGEHFICPDGIQPADKTSEDFQIVPETLGQFTGLHDCNGKEIYEGDIVMTHVIFAYNHEEIREFWRVGEIRFIAGGFNLTNCTNYYTRIMKGKSDIQPNPKSKFDFPAYRTQLIGNIHENPELLKGGEE